MRLSDMRPRRDDAPLPAEVEAELAALDAALAGEDVPAGMEGLATLVGDLEVEKPSPSMPFGEELNRWAAAGFPRAERPGGSSAPRRDPRRFLEALTPRRFAYAGGAVAAAVVVAVAVAQIDFGGDEPATNVAAEEAAPLTTEGRSDAETAQQNEAPPVIDDEQRDGGAYPGGADLLDGDVAEGLRSGRRDRRALFGLSARTPNAAVLDRLNPNSPARGRENRKVERDAQLTLAAPADEVQDVTNEALGVIDAHDGIVESSQTSGTEDSARATLQLLIPTRELDATLDELSDLADVRSLSEGTVDITRPFVDAKKRMDGLRAERRSLLAQIETADTEAELDSLKARLADVERVLAQAEAQFRNVQRQAALSSVTLQITSEGADEGDWSLEDALDDAGRVLTVGAGIALISAAVLLPLALIAGIAYFVLSAARNRSRERALDE